MTVCGGGVGAAGRCIFGANGEPAGAGVRDFGGRPISIKDAASRIAAGFEAGPDAPPHDGRRDRIFLRDYVFALEIGAYDDEVGAPQRLRVNVDLEIRRVRAEFADEVESVVSYDLIIDAIDALAAGPRMKLLETFAERLAARLLENDHAMRATIRIEKLDRVSGSLGVEIERSAGA